jgi:ribosomal protein L37AE/L43A
MKPNYICPYCGNENNLILLPNDLHPGMKEGDKTMVECEWCHKKAYAYYENGIWTGYGMKMNNVKE